MKTKKDYLKLKVKMIQRRRRELNQEIEVLLEASAILVTTFTIDTRKSDKVDLLGRAIRLKSNQAEARNERLRELESELEKLNALGELVQSLPG